MKKIRPTGIKILSVLYYISSALMLLFSVILFFSALYISQNVELVEASFTAEELALIGSIASLVPIFYFVSFLLLCLSVFDFFIGRGFWKGQKWARIAMVILSIVSIVYSLVVLVLAFGVGISSIISNALGLLINGFILWYLLRKNVIAYFHVAQKK